MMLCVRACVCGSHVRQVLRNTKTGEWASVIPSAGGGVDDLHLLAPGAATPTQVLWNHGRNATEVKHNPTWKGRILLPYANRIGGAKYVFNGTEYHLPINDVAGLNNSLHGLLYDRDMTVLATEATDHFASVTLGYNFTGADKGYPFALGVRLIYTLCAPGHPGCMSTTGSGWSITVEATNLDAGGWPLPFYNGWHPYFVTQVDQATLSLDPCTSWNHVDVHTGPQYPPPRYSNMVPSGHTQEWRRFTGSQTFGGNASMPTYFDDEVKARQSASCDAGYRYRLKSPKDGLTFVLATDAHYRYLQIFTGAKSAFGTIDAVVLEPLSAMSDAYNNHDGLHVISAGETFTSKYGIYLDKL